jgi:nucleotide-binding universal stress UspA family protein
MYTSILVPLDGTAYAEAALTPAVRLARKCGATIRLVRVIDRTAPSFVLASARSSITWADTPGDRASYYLHHLAERIHASTGVEASTNVLRGGIAASIRKEAIDNHCDLIVMTTHGHGAPGRILQTSVGAKIAYSSTCAVLFIPHSESPTDWSVQKRYTHVLVPLDGSHNSEQSVAMALQFAQLDDARLTLFHVAQPQLVAAASATAPLFTSQNAIPPEDVERMSRDYMESLGGWVHEHGGTAFTDVRIDSGDPAAAILAFAGEHAVDLIAMTTRGLTGLRKFVLGSVSSAVLRRTNAAILLLPPQAAR